ncbi:MAG: hypothetical protein Udaeo2_00670 [Candidatus Udaeobacter sp.]|nr:MAG: hypothetical protein Udaeo2_00670 [Candidatus Udaeobacter sp.]
MEKVSNMMRLHNLQPRPGSRHRVKRLGCVKVPVTEKPVARVIRDKGALRWEYSPWVRRRADAVDSAIAKAGI